MNIFEYTFFIAVIELLLAIESSSLGSYRIGSDLWDLESKGSGPKVRPNDAHVLR